MIKVSVRIMFMVRVGLVWIMDRFSFKAKPGARVRSMSSAKEC
jgi:hypothetical protein